MSSSACGSQKRLLDLWGLELQMAVCCPTNKLWASADITGVGGHTGKCKKHLRVRCTWKAVISASHTDTGSEHFLVHRQNGHLVLLCKLRGTGNSPIFPGQLGKPLLCVFTSWF